VLIASGITGLAAGAACAALAGLSLAQTAQVLGAGTVMGLGIGLVAVLVQGAVKPPPSQPGSTSGVETTPISPDPALLADSQATMSRLSTRCQLVEVFLGAQQLVQKSSGYQGRDSETAIKSQLRQSAKEWEQSQPGRPEPKPLVAAHSKESLQ